MRVYFYEPQNIVAMWYQTGPRTFRKWFLDLNTGASSDTPSWGISVSDLGKLPDGRQWRELLWDER